MEQKITGTAYFLMDARRIEDLEAYWREHYPKRMNDKPYIVEKVIELGKIDYENFSTDLLADRDFIRDNLNLMQTDADGGWHCILVVQKGKLDNGILISSKGFDFPKFSAYYHKSPEMRLL